MYIYKFVHTCIYIDTILFHLISVYTHLICHMSSNSSPKSSPEKNEKKKVFKMGGGGISADGTKKVKKEKKSPSRLTRFIPQEERKNEISAYLNRKKKSLLTKNIEKKMDSFVQEGVDEYNAKKSKEAGQMLKQVYLIEKRNKLSNFKVENKQARKEVKAKVKGKWVYDKPLSRLKPGEFSNAEAAYRAGKPKDFKDIPDRFPATLLERT